MTVTGNAPRSAVPSAPGLRERLRAETAEWHDRVESVADVPRSVRTLDDYLDLLDRLHALHSGFERRLAAAVFDAGWRTVGVDIAEHDRAYLLAADIEKLAADTTKLGGRRPRTAAGSVSLPTLPTFGHAIGCLYVLEGSALGGRTVAKVVRAALGEVPTTFLNSAGRLHDKPWPAVVGALRRFEAQGGDGDQVIVGACETFATFAAHLSASPSGIASSRVDNLARSR